MGREDFGRLRAMSMTKSSIRVATVSRQSPTHRFDTGQRVLIVAGCSIAAQFRRRHIGAKLRFGHFFAQLAKRRRQVDIPKAHKAIVRSIRPNTKEPAALIGDGAMAASRCASVAAVVSRDRQSERAYRCQPRTRSPGDERAFSTNVAARVSSTCRPANCSSRSAISMKSSGGLSTFAIDSSKCHRHAVPCGGQLGHSHMPR